MSQPPKSACCGAPVNVQGSDEGTHYYVCEKCQKACDTAPPQPASDEEWFIPLVDHIQSSGYKHDAYSIVETIVDSASRRGAKEAIEGIIEKTNSYLDLLKRDTNRESCMDCYQLLREQLNELKKRYE